MKKRGVLMGAGLAAILLAGWLLFPKKPRVSDDIGALQGVVQIAIPATSIKWEIYKVPDDEGLFAIGPVDYVQLVAEVVPGERSWFARQPDDGSTLSAGPDAARGWLSPAFRTLLADPKTEWRRSARCKSHRTTVTSSGRPVKGFVCEHGGLLLLYLMLSS